MNKKLVILVFILLIVSAGLVFKDRLLRVFYTPTETLVETGVTMQEVEKQKPQTLDKPDIETVVEDLNIPWELVFLPSGEMLVTERPGNLLKIGAGKKIIKIDGVRHYGEGGLLGLALHPNFSSNSYIYLYFTSNSGGKVSNRVERYKLQDDTLIDRSVILDNIPGAIYHDGGRIAFGPDGYLYITTGDATQENLAQDTTSLAGKILKVKDDGGIPPDNPFGNVVYSFGHRNVQGIAWDSEERLWATEHGRSGTQSGLDEVNLIVKGSNYGWPTIQGDQTRGGMVTPVINSGPSVTWAPSGMLIYQNKLFFAGLRGESLYEVTISSDELISLKANFRQEFGRLRTVVLGPDGYFYFLTNNTDGRGTPKTGDDKIIRLNPDIFK